MTSSNSSYPTFIPSIPVNRFCFCFSLNTQNSTLKTSLLPHLHPHFPAPRSVEFAEKHRLPSPQLQFAAADNDGNAAAYQRGFDMGGGITFAVSVVVNVRDDFVQFHHNIAADGRVGVFVDSDGGGGVRDEDSADAVFDAAGKDGVFHKMADVDHFRAAAGFDDVFFHFIQS